jgi:hypothetical protein
MKQATLIFFLTFLTTLTVGDDDKAFLVRTLVQAVLRHRKKHLFFHSI